MCKVKIASRERSCTSTVASLLAVHPITLSNIRSNSSFWLFCPFQYAMTMLYSAVERSCPPCVFCSSIATCFLSFFPSLCFVMLSLNIVLCYILSVKLLYGFCTAQIPQVRSFYKPPCLWRQRFVFLHLPHHLFCLHPFTPQMADPPSATLPVLAPSYTFSCCRSSVQTVFWIPCHS